MTIPVFAPPSGFDFPASHGDIIYPRSMKRHRRPGVAATDDKKYRGGLCVCRPMSFNERGTTAPGYADNKDADNKQLRRIEGQVRGLQQMVEEDTKGIDVLTQVHAAVKPV
ncbi:MAG TPA: metal-sensitive transcriptional regulator [Acidothermaceae bacterium]